MTKVHFYRYIPYETGFMGNFDLSEYEIPINIFVDNAEDFPDLKECDAEMDIFGISQSFKLFKSEAEYEAAGTNMAVQSMIPSGTFSVLSEDKKFAPSPEIIYNGIVKSLEKDDDAQENQPNYCLEIETYGMTFHLFVHIQEEVCVGDIVSGGAWLYGDIVVEE
jgi:hypothetical protein